MSLSARRSDGYFFTSRQVFRASDSEKRAPPPRAKLPFLQEKRDLNEQQ
jgi:hypothetical protein